jgi:Protein of unknown function, DUF488
MVECWIHRSPRACRDHVTQGLGAVNSVQDNCRGGRVLGARLRFGAGEHGRGIAATLATDGPNRGRPSLRLDRSVTMPRSGRRCAMLDVDDRREQVQQVNSTIMIGTETVAGGMRPGLYSIGHSNVSLDVLLDLLQRHRIDVVADVRTSPRSRYVPHFDAQPLQGALSRRNIKYVALGRELGGRPDGDEFYDEQDHVLYCRLAATQTFQEGIERILRGVEVYRVALLCSEEDPSQCHRHLLIGRVLRGRGTALLHIRGDGSIQNDSDLGMSQRNDNMQAIPFESIPEERRWRSTRSVSRKRPPLSSSER